MLPGGSWNETPSQVSRDTAEDDSGGESMEPVDASGATLYRNHNARLTGRILPASPIGVSHLTTRLQGGRGAWRCISLACAGHKPELKSGAENGPAVPASAENQKQHNWQNQTEYALTNVGPYRDNGDADVDNQKSPGSGGN